MISFIIIGRNEGWKLSKCFESVFKTIKQNKLEKYEVIYVDSDSTDDSIKRAQSNNCIKTFKITSKPNAAIALFNLDEDIAEKNNIATKHPEIVTKMNDIMKNARTHSDMWPFYKAKTKQK